MIISNSFDFLRGTAQFLFYTQNMMPYIDQQYCRQKAVLQEDIPCNGIMQP